MRLERQELRVFISYVKEEYFYTKDENQSLKGTEKEEI